MYHIDTKRKLQCDILCPRTTVFYQLLTRRVPRKLAKTTRAEMNFPDLLQEILVLICT